MEPIAGLGVPAGKQKDDRSNGEYGSVVLAHGDEVVAVYPQIHADEYRAERNRAVVHRLEHNDDPRVKTESLIHIGR
jgi:hypothetical protein